MSELAEQRPDIGADSPFPAIAESLSRIICIAFGDIPEREILKDSSLRIQQGDIDHRGIQTAARFLTFVAAIDFDVLHNSGKPEGLLEGTIKYIPKLVVARGDVRDGYLLDTDAEMIRHYPPGYLRLSQNHNPFQADLAFYELQNMEYGMTAFPQYAAVNGERLSRK